MRREEGEDASYVCFKGFKGLLVSMDVLLTNKEVGEYLSFGFKVLWGREGVDIPVNNKYHLLAK